jgi:bisphosphoglycerate-dependent phosphoglycerate mutase
MTAATISSSEERSRRLSSMERPISLPHGEKTVYFIRHGQSTGNVTPTETRRCDLALVDCGLTSLGIEQSRQIPKYLAQAAGAESVELVIASPLTRALLVRSVVCILFVGTAIARVETGSRPWNLCCF